MKLVYKFLLFLIVLLFALAYTQNFREGVTSGTTSGEQKSHKFTQGQLALPEDINTFIDTSHPYIAVINNTNITGKLSAMSTAGLSPRLVLSIPMSSFTKNSNPYNEIMTNIKNKLGTTDITLGTVYKFVPDHYVPNT